MYLSLSFLGVLFYFIPNRASMIVIILDKLRHVETQSPVLAPSENPEFANEGDRAWQDQPVVNGGEPSG